MKDSNEDCDSNEELLIKAISNNSLQDVINIVSNCDVKLNFTDKHGMNSLQHACYKGNYQIANYLLERGADVNQNDHEHGYTALMFAALGGHTGVITLLLEHGANVSAVNSVGRNASQMAAFVGQHQSVAIINNFIPRSYIEYYSKITGLESDPRLTVRLIQPVHSFVRIVNINPIRIIYFLKSNFSLIDENKKISNVLELLCEKFMKSGEPNEMFSLKMHYLNFIFKNICKFVNSQSIDSEDLSRSSAENVLNTLIKSWLKVNSDGCSEVLERLLRESVRSYPYQENSLFQQLVRTLATVKIGEDPTTLSILSQVVLGKGVDSDETYACFTCSETNPDKRCSKCKVATYCDQNCQKLHWPVHKKMCDQLLKQK